jgi:hypothetical protein
VSVLAALAALILAAAGAAAPGWFVSPPPPRGAEPADIDAWVHDNVVVGDYLQTGYNPNAVVFLSTSGVDVTGADRLRIWLRFENFRPALVAEAEVRSVRILTEFDCRRRLYRSVSYELYPGANMTGVPRLEDAATAPWLKAEPNSSAGVNAEVLCTLKESLEHAPAVEDPAP